VEASACVPLLAPDLMEEFRAMVLKNANEWVDGFAPLFEQGTPPQLLELSDHFQATRLELLGACMKAAVEKLYAPYLEQEWADCPLCDKSLHRKRCEPKTLSTAQGRFVLDRPYFYCGECRHGFCPLDEALGVAPGRHQYDVQKQLTITSARMPFEEASGLFEQLTAIAAGNSFAHDTLTAIAEAATIELVMPTAEEIERRIELATETAGALPILVVSSDGANERTRPKAPRKRKRGKGQYKEVKGFRIYLLTPDDRIVSIASWHEFQNAKTFAAALEVAASRIAREKLPICLVGDGAGWVWNTMERCFPNARQILDFYHCFEHVHVVARAQHGEGSIAGRQWAEKVMIRLSEGKIAHVIASTRRLKPRSDEAQEEIRQFLVYLQNHGHQINYFEDIEAGYPIGSGAIESANKKICHARLKRSGAWWVIDYGNNMLRIRCALENGTFERVFEHYIASTVSNTKRRKIKGHQNE
jgi:hypothetical protein